MFKSTLKCFVLWVAVSVHANAITFHVDPISRDVLIKYPVPELAPKEILVSCEYSLGDTGFRRAAVRKYRSSTAERILSLHPNQKNLMKSEMRTGTVKEWMAAGLERTLVWQTGRQLASGELNEVTVKITLRDGKGNVLQVEEQAGEIDLSDVIILSDFSKVLQKDAVALKKRSGPGWYWIEPEGNDRDGLLQSGKSDFPLHPLTLRPTLKGVYAIYVGLPYSLNGCISMRLSDEIYSQVFSAEDPKERFWKIADLTGRNIVISQWDQGLKRTALQYIRLVPVSPEAYRTAKEMDEYPRDKFVAGFTEPFSWGGSINFTENYRYAGPLAAFRDSKLDWVDFQMGRLGMRPVSPTVIDEPIVGASRRETGPGSAVVMQNGSALLSMTTDAFTASKIFADAFGVNFSANFGAGIAYKNETLRSEWAKTNAQYIVKGTWPQYKYPEVRKEILSYFKEFLEKGAKRLSLDFCRYPYVIEEDDTQTATRFLTELRTLADQYATENEKVQILVRFPIEGVPGQGDNYNATEWVEKGLVDVIVPSGRYSNVNYFDVSPYLEMVRETNVKCLPCVNLLAGALPFPGQVLRRVDQLYDAGCEGVYLYQSGPMIVGEMKSESAWARSVVARMGSSRAVKQMLREFEEANKDYSREIYIHYPRARKACRARVWIEGFVPEKVATYIEGERTNIFDSSEKFHRFGEDGMLNDYSASSVPALFSVEAKLEGKWIQRELKIKRIY